MAFSGVFNRNAVARRIKGAPAGGRKVSGAPGKSAGPMVIANRKGHPGLRKSKEWTTMPVPKRNPTRIPRPNTPTGKIIPKKYGR